MTGQLPAGWSVTFKPGEQQTPPAGAPALPDGWSVSFAPPATPPKEVGVGEYVDSIGRRLATGMTFGFADELAAGADAVTQPLLGRGSDAKTISERYDANLKTERDKDKAFETQHPVSANSAELGGAVAGGFAAPVLRTGKVAVEALKEAPTLLARTMKSLGLGAGGGAVYGFGSGEGGFGNRAEGAATGAVIGGATGAAIPSIVEVTKRVGTSVADALGWRNAGRSAMDQLLRAFERDGVSPDDAARRLEAWHGAGAKPETLADLGGENVKGLAANAANVPGRAKTIAQQTVEARTQGAPDRVQADLQGTLRPQGNYAESMDALTAARSADAAPLYDAAFSKQGVWSPRLNQFLDDPIMRDGLARGMKMLRLEAVSRGERFDPTTLGVTLNEAGDVTHVSVPNMRVLDAAKRGLDDILEKYRDQTTGRLRLTPEGRAVNEFRASYLRTLDDLNPDYATARASYAGPSQSMDAMAMGRNIFTPDAEVTTRTIRDMTPGEREFFKIGVARAIEDKINNTADGRNVVASFFNKRGQRDRIAAAFDSEADFNSFRDLMARENDIAATNRVISPRAGSHTDRLKAGRDDMEIDPALGFWGNLVTGHPIQAARVPLRSLYDASQGMNSKTADALAPLLYSTDPVRNSQILRSLAAADRANREVASRRVPFSNGMYGYLGPAEMGLLTDGRQRRQ